MLVGTIRTLEDLARIGRQRTVADRCVVTFATTR
jgi:hypothetical protein